MQYFAGCFLLDSASHCRASHTSCLQMYFLHPPAFWYDGQCTVTAVKARHVAADKVSTALTWLHNIGGCRDIVEQTLPVLLGGQWTNLQHHSLADKLQVSLVPCCSGSPIHHCWHPPAQYSTAYFELSLCTSKSAASLSTQPGKRTEMKMLCLLASIY